MKAAALHQPHREKVLAVHLADLVDRQDVRVGKGACSLELENVLSSETETESMGGY